MSHDGRFVEPFSGPHQSSIDFERRLGTRHNPGDIGIFAGFAGRTFGAFTLAVLTPLGLLLLALLARELLLPLLVGIYAGFHRRLLFWPGQDKKTIPGHQIFPAASMIAARPATSPA